jgi:predicted nucleic acid-binding protein
VTTGVNSVFVDTNVLVYANVASAPLHQEALEAIRVQRHAGATLWVSRQVLREYLATLSRSQTYTVLVSKTILTAQVRAFEHEFQIADESAAVTNNLLALYETVNLGGKQVHDANIVATMQVYGITHLLTHNVSDFVRFSGLITVIPLVTATP